MYSVTKNVKRAGALFALVNSPIDLLTFCRIRNITLTGSATSGSAVLDYMSQPDESLMIGSVFSIFEQRVFLSFESSRSPNTRTGFNITYCAGFRAYFLQCY